MSVAYAEDGPSSSTDGFESAARQLLRLRQERKKHFQPVELTGPTWPLMLALYAHPSGSTDLSLGDLSVEADLPRTTALRGLRWLQRHGLVRLFSDSSDRRVVRVRITGEGRRGMQQAFASATNGTN